MPDEDSTAYAFDTTPLLHRDALEAVRDVVLIVTGDGLVRDANLAAEQAYGRSREELLGISITELRAPSVRTTVLQQLQRASEAGMTFETIHVRKDGSTFPVEVSSSPFEHAGPGGVISVVRDITRRRENEELRARLIDQLSEANARLDGALTLLSSAVGAPDLDTLLQRSVTALSEVMDTDAALFLVRDGSRLHVRAQFGADEWAPVGSDIGIDEGFSGQVARSDGPVYIADVSATGPLHDTHRDIGITSLFGVPVCIEGELFGVLECVWREERTVDETETSMVELAAERIGLAINRERQFEAEHHIAETLQEAMLLMPPSVRGLEFAHLYRSATLSTRVGGDFFDIFEMTDERVGVIVGDVSGKGLEAAVLTSIIKDTIRAYAHDVVSPAAVIAKANAVLGGVSQLPAFASVFFAVLDVSTGTMMYCSAGHPPAAIVRADGHVRLLDGHSPVIGALPDMVYTDETTVVGHDETVVLYTDGVTEARDTRGAFFGEEGLQATLSAASDGDVGDLPTSLFESVLAFAERRLTDDIALLAFRLGHGGTRTPVQ